MVTSSTEIIPLQAEALYGAVRSHIDAIPDPTAYIHEQLIPLMDAHRGRTEPLAWPTIITKLFSTGAKLGELVEYTDEYLKTREPTPARALEAADVVYYTEQPGWYEWPGEEPVDNEEQEELRRLTEGLFMFPYAAAQRLCILKYLARVNLTSALPKEEREAIELQLATRFLGEAATQAAMRDWRDNYEREYEVWAMHRRQRVDSLPPLLATGHHSSSCLLDKIIFHACRFIRMGWK